MVRRRAGLASKREKSRVALNNNENLFDEETTCYSSYTGASFGRQKALKTNMFMG